HPAHLVERGGKAALHVGQRDVGDGDVQHLHDGGHHHADGDHQPPQLRGKAACCRCADHGSGFSAAALAPKSLASLPRRPMSISTVALMPERRRLRSWPGANSMRIGTRCTILIQFPAAFWGGRMANWAPVPGLIAPTRPFHSRSGNASMVMV